MNSRCKVCRILEKYCSEAERNMLTVTMYRKDKSDYAIASFIRDVLRIEVSHESVGYHRKNCMAIPQDVKSQNETEGVPLSELIIMLRRRSHSI